MATTKNCLSTTPKRHSFVDHRFVGIGLEQLSRRHQQEVVVLVQRQGNQFRRKFLTFSVVDLSEPPRGRLVNCLSMSSRKARSTAAPNSIATKANSACR